MSKKMDFIHKKTLYTIIGGFIFVSGLVVINITKNDFFGLICIVGFLMAIYNIIGLEV